jgi:hypothetical protein
MTRHGSARLREEESQIINASLSLCGDLLKP